MKVFISSVRHGLEEERDALPGLISAVGHSPIRFEDFTAQPVPSREACLAGIAEADVYLLMLGPQYGHRFPDTGQSPTHDEWVAAGAAGLPRLVYRKSGVTFEAEQHAFARSITDYPTGVFYDSFSNAPDLLTKVAGKLRELADGADPLDFSPLATPVATTWRSDFEDNRDRLGLSATPIALEIHVASVEATRRSGRVMAELEDALPARLRESQAVDVREALNVSGSDDAVMITLPFQHPRPGIVRDPQLLGVRVGSDGQASVWETLPSDGMGSILDDADLPGQIIRMLRLLGAIRVFGSARLAIAVGVNPTMMLSFGRVAQLPRSSASMLSLSDRPIRVEADESVSPAALNVGAPEVARVLSRALLNAARRR